MATTTTLLQLNEDCLFQIFEKLNLSELLRIADTCTQLNTIARTHYKNSLPSSSSVKYTFKELGDKEIIRAFQIFGKYFNIIDSTEFNIPEYQYQLQDKFIELISDYCTANLVQLQLHRFEINTNVIEKLNLLFITLETIEFNCCYFPQDGIVTNIFPNQCTKLNIFTLDCADVGCDPENSRRLFTLNQHFPLLQHISFNNAHIIDMPVFFQKNQQLINYTEKNCNNRILQYVVQFLRHIQSLNLSFIDSGIYFENIHCLQELNSLSMSSDIFEAVIDSNSSLASTSLQNVHLRSFNLSYETTDITKFINLKTLTLESCTIAIDYIIEICKSCNEITEINVTSEDYPTTDQLFEIVRNANKLEKLLFPGGSSFQSVAFATFLHLAQIVRNRNTKIFISIGTQNRNTIAKTLTDKNIELQYTSIVENVEID